MNSRKSTPVIFIPGLGKQHGLYKVAVWWWQVRGFEARIFDFGWKDASSNFDARLKELHKYLDGFKSAHLVGVSAGGTAALNAMADHNAVKKVVLLATPLKPHEGLDNKMLEQALKTLPKTLKRLSPAQKKRILVAYGIYDQRVAVSNSRQLDAVHHRIPLVRHAIIIAGALTIFCSGLQRFLARQGIEK